DLGEQFPQPFRFEPFKTAELNFRQAWQIEQGGRLRIILAAHARFLGEHTGSVRGWGHVILFLDWPENDNKTPRQTGCPSAPLRWVTCLHPGVLNSTQMFQTYFNCTNQNR